jgi:type IV pilus assembly protein PilC
LRVIASSTSRKYWRNSLREMRDMLEQGVQLSDVLTTHHEVFPPYYLGIIESAEMTGRLDIALEQLSHYIERDLDIRAKIKAALLYPIIVLAMAAVTVSVLTIWVLPKFARFFKNLNARLPATTRALVAVANFSKHNWWVYLVAMIAFGVLAIWLLRTRTGRSVASRVALRLPISRDIVRFAAVERVCRILAAMASSGVPLSDAMVATIRSASNDVFEKGLQRAQAQMLEGEGLAGPLAASKLFPEAAIEMIRVGEQTGTLELQLGAVADFYARELEYKLRRLTTVFEPLILVLVGLIVGFVAIALVQAMYGAYHTPALNHVK